MNLRSWPFSKKITVFGVSLAAGGATIFASYLFMMRENFKVQDRYRNASEVHRLLGEIKMGYSNKVLGLLTYMDKPTPENWAEVERVRKKAEEDFGQLRFLSFDPKLEEHLGEIGKFDESLMPLDKKLKYVVDSGLSSGLLKWYITWYQPGYVRIQRILQEASNLTEKDQEIAYQEQRSLAFRNAFIMGIVILIGTVAAFVLSRVLGKMLGVPLERAIQKLENETDLTRRSVEEIKHAAESVSSSATEQAAALQETAASVEEMSAMISKSADNAAKSGKAAQNSAEVAEKGKEASQRLIGAIREINASNSDIMTAVQDSNRKISEIVAVISEIGNKTKVINDIVFQTKLLSFNASVEAARAGEHGKGFSVVAEEVGSLAEMSGSAAKEIASMLQGSIEKVDGIISETKTRVERLIEDGRKKVESGTQIAEQTGRVLEDIFQQVGSVNLMVGEIATASQEQAHGVSEINKAMTQLDQVTQQNSGVSHQIAGAAERLSAQVEALRSVMGSLEVIVHGEQNPIEPAIQVAEEPMHAEVQS